MKPTNELTREQSRALLAAKLGATPAGVALAEAVGFPLDTAPDKCGTSGESSGVGVKANRRRVAASKRGAASRAAVAKAQAEFRAAKAVPTESAEQSALVAWFRAEFANLGLRDARQLIASQAGTMLGGSGDGLRFARFAKLKREGFVGGVPDLFLAHPVAPFAGLWIEMKRVKGGSVRPDQREMHDLLRRAGYAVEVAKGAREAQDVIELYVVGRYPPPSA